CQQHDSYPRTF
nr:immunoglobulin light chain junction region [Macaca mulatta]MOW14376.1 immunoglobulin light chain junction region [Macaca mulatta]